MGGMPPPPRNTLRKERRGGGKPNYIEPTKSRSGRPSSVATTTTPNHRIGGGGHRPKIPLLPTYTQRGRKSHDNSMIIAQIPPSSSYMMERKTRKLYVGVVFSFGANCSGNSRCVCVCLSCFGGGGGGGGGSKRTRGILLLPPSSLVSRNT